MGKETFITPKEAVEYAKEKSNGVINVTTVTMRTWVVNEDIGRKIGGRWFIDKDKLHKYLDLDQFNDKSKKK